MAQTRNLIQKMIYSTQKRNNNQSGFSLIEILISLLLITVITYVMVNMGFQRHNILRDTVNEIERAIRYSSAESTFRNKIIRIYFDLELEEQKFSVEQGPDSSFILPSINPKSNTINMNKKKRELTDNINQQFNKIRDFGDSIEIDSSIKIIGIATSNQEKLISDSNTSIYFYVTGEKDDAIIIMAADNEIAIIKSYPFSMEIETEYRAIPEHNQSPEETYEAIAKEEFDKWQKN